MSGQDLVIDMDRLKPGDLVTYDGQMYCCVEEYGEGVDLAMNEHSLPSAPPKDMGKVVCVRGHPAHMTRDEVQGKRVLTGYDYLTEGEQEWLTMRFADGTSERWEIEYVGERPCRPPWAQPSLMGPGSGFGQ